MINMQQLLNQAKSMGIAPKKINEVEEMAKKYGIIDQNGNVNGNLTVAKKVMQENGGIGVVESAIKKANNPIVKTFLNKIGINTDTVNNIVGELKGATGNKVDNSKDDISKISSRLNKLR